MVDVLLFYLGQAVAAGGLLWGVLAVLELLKAPQTLHRRTRRPVWQIHMLEAVVVLLLGFAISFLSKKP